MPIGDENDTAKCQITQLSELFALNCRQLAIDFFIDDYSPCDTAERTILTSEVQSNLDPVTTWCAQLPPDLAHRFNSVRFRGIRTFDQMVPWFLAVGWPWLTSWGRTRIRSFASLPIGSAFSQFGMKSSLLVVVVLVFLLVLTENLKAKCLLKMPGIERKASAFSTRCFVLFVNLKWNSDVKN